MTLKSIQSYSKSDILIGALDENLITKKHFIATRAYYRDKLTWCVRAKQQIPFWQNLFRLCIDPLVYLFFILVSTLTVGARYLMAQFEREYIKWDLFKFALNAYSALLGFVSNYKPKFLPARINYIVCIFSCVVFTQHIFSIMISAMKTPMFTDQIQSIPEILDARNAFELTGDRFALEHLRKQNEVRSNSNSFTNVFS